MTRARKATADERRRAANIRRRLRRGSDVGKKDLQWLDRYAAARSRFKLVRASRTLSMREEAETICRLLADWLGPHAAIESEWARPSRPGVPGIAHATAEFDKGLPVIVYGPDGRAVANAIDLLPEPPAMPIKNVRGHLANVHAHLQIGPDDKWTSLVALTPDWHDLPANVYAALLALKHRESPKMGDYEVEILAISVQVSTKSGD